MVCFTHLTAVNKGWPMKHVTSRFVGRRPQVASQGSRRDGQRRGRRDRWSGPRSRPPWLCDARQRTEQHPDRVQSVGAHESGDHRRARWQRAIPARLGHRDQSQRFRSPTDSWGLDACADVVSAVQYLPGSDARHRLLAQRCHGHERLARAGRWPRLRRTHRNRLARERRQSPPRRPPRRSSTRSPPAQGATRCVGSFPADDSGNAPSVHDSTCGAAGVAVALSGSSSSSVVVMPNSGGQSVVTTLAHPTRWQRLHHAARHRRLDRRLRHRDVRWGRDLDHQHLSQGAGKLPPRPSPPTPTDVEHLAISATDTFYATARRWTPAQMSYYRKPVGQAAVQVSGIATWPSSDRTRGRRLPRRGPAEGGTPGSTPSSGTTVKRVWTPPLPALSARLRRRRAGARPLVR